MSGLKITISIRYKKQSYKKISTIITIFKVKPQQFYIISYFQMLSDITLKYKKRN